LNEGHEVPDLSQMELRKCEPETGVAEEQVKEARQTFNCFNIKTSKSDCARKSNLKQENQISKSDSLGLKNSSPVSDQESLAPRNEFFVPRKERKPLKNVVSQLASSVIDDIYKTPAQFGWTRKIVLRSSDNLVTSVVYFKSALDGSRLRCATRKDVSKVLDNNTERQFLSIGHFCFKRKILGFADLEEVVKFEDCVMKPFQSGWLRKVNMRTSDSQVQVTNVAYLAPPDSQGKRQRFQYKKEIEVMLLDTRNKELDVEDFVFVRRVLGVSPDSEQIYSNNLSSRIPGVKSAVEADCNNPTMHSHDHVVSGSSSEDSTDDSFSDSDDDSNGSLDDSDDGLRIVPASTVQMPPDKFIKKKSPVCSRLPPTGSLSQPVLENSKHAAPTIKSNNNLQDVQAPTSKVTLLMVSSEKCDGEGKKRRLRMSVKYGVRIEKGMKMFAHKFEEDFRKLRFFSDIGEELTGWEMAGELTGARIWVEGMA